MQFNFQLPALFIMLTIGFASAAPAFLDSASVKGARQSYTERVCEARYRSVYVYVPVYSRVETLKFSRIKVKNLRYRHQPRPCITWTEYELVTSTDLDRGYTYLDTAEARGAKYG
ncbi:hypothetical protein C8R45DRAFT_936397 [Mycena sanguinolenta]|nr:hypothetical protein C8R45DRAFT_936397 [Mycena sanguinolenta]